MNTAKVFKSGNSQAIRVPKKFRIKGDRVFIRKFGKGLLIEPAFENNDQWLKELMAYPDDLFDERNQPDKAEIREGF